MLYNFLYDINTKLTTLYGALSDVNSSLSNLWFALSVIVCIVVPYLLGSLNFGVILSSRLYKDDVRRHGSGNAGTTNMLRNYGKKAGVLTLLGDMLKMAAACVIGAFVGPHYYGLYIAGLFCIMGHMFPIFFKFKGGKGIACLAMMVLMTDIKAFLFLIFAFIVIVAGTRYVSLGSVVCAMMYPVILNRVNPEVPFGWLIATVIAAFVVFMHRENIKRLWNGNENKLSFGKKKKPEETENIEKAE